MSDPTVELQFTDEEIDHGVHALLKLRQSAKRDPFGAGSEPVAEVVRTVLRAVRAVPARCLNGHLAGEPAAVGTKVRGTGLGGAWIQGEVLESYPVTTIVRAPDGRTDYLWTNTIRSWDPSTDRANWKTYLLEALDEELVFGPPSAGKTRVTISADQPETVEITGPVTDPKIEGMHPIGVNPATGGIVFVPDPALVADDDGMPCEGER